MIDVHRDIYTTTLGKLKATWFVAKLEGDSKTMEAVMVSIVRLEALLAPCGTPPDSHDNCCAVAGCDVCFPPEVLAPGQCGLCYETPCKPGCIF